MSGDPNFPLVQEAKRCKYTLIPKHLSEEDVLQIWLHVSQFIIRQLIQQKAVNISGLGMFSVLQRRLDLGSNRKLCLQRPIFILSEKFAKTHALNYTKYKSSGDIPVIQLNFAVISMDIGYDRDVVEICTKEIVGAFSRAVNSRKSMDLSFRDIGRLVIKEGKAKMKFAKDFLKTMDGTRTFALSPLALAARPQSSTSFISRGSVMSSQGSFRPNTFVLPSARSRLGWINAQQGLSDPMERPPSVISNHSGALTLSPLEIVKEVNKEGTIHENEIIHHHTSSTVSFNDEMLTACGPAPPASFTTDVLAYDGGMELEQLAHRKLKTDLKPSILKTDDLKDEESESPCNGNVSFGPKTVENGEALPEEISKEISCDHKSGQELCYLCHQRQKRNVPISFTEEKDRSELEQDRVLQQYQQLKDQTYYGQEQRYIDREREICKDVAQFNLSTSEKLKINKTPLNEFHHSYIFNRRGASPQRFLAGTQEEYSNDLGEQVKIKTERSRRWKDENDRLEQNEQKHLAQELAEARKSYLESKLLATKKYQSALSTQLKTQPFRFPRAEPDSDGPIFGLTDVTPEKVAEMRKRSKEVLNHQLRTIGEKKAKVQREKDESRKYETEILKRTKTELRDDSYRRFQLTNSVRKELESNWITQHSEKQKRDYVDRKHQMRSGLLLLDQCDKYDRCRQCRRCCDNIGTSNVWRESRYISGSRLMV